MQIEEEAPRTMVKGAFNEDQKKEFERIKSIILYIEAYMDRLVEPYKNTMSEHELSFIEYEKNDREYRYSEERLL
ncbi:hypothetical protein K1W69_01905 [Hoeflea sp. WL0058]|uniref:Uncharacterized protein n=1 Tax=Flavimaribacter sediminis TaxID=2865987 RepID=A0AAE2ZKC6_9HYPH|nr:hypothetical protein [Flavimaribacter sediminis]MBW8635923.1 hypothetical protein [Flavimaribacter sediminis]